MKALRIFGLMGVFAIAAAAWAEGDRINLSDRLDLVRTDLEKKLSPEQRAQGEKSIAQLKKKSAAKKAPRVGATLPDFTLPSHSGGEVKLSDLVKEGPVVVTFFRGSWCPYCTAQLLHYQENLQKIREAGGRLVAITPEVMEQSKIFARAKGLEFPLLWDKEGAYAKQIKLLFQLDADTKKMYQGAGIDLAKTQGSESWSLPVPATFVVDKNRRVTFAFVDVDYRRRAETADLVEAVKRAPR